MGIWLRSSGFQLVQDQAREYAELAGQLADPAKQQADPIVKEVNEGLNFRFMRVVPAPRYDLAWAGIFRLRHLFCTQLAPAELCGRIIEHVRADLNYLHGEDLTKTTAELDDIGAVLLNIVAGHPNDDKQAGARTRLVAASRRVAEARQSRWLKVNMKRSRLALEGILLAIGLVLAVIALPSLVSGHDGVFFLGLVGAGAIGGLVSSLFSPESVDAAATDFYVSRRLLYLRPLVGAAAALASDFAVQAGLLTIVGIDKTSDTQAFLVLAFASGFSERLIVNKVINPLTGPKAGDDTPKAPGQGAVAH